MIDLFKKNELLSRHTNFRIGGPAKFFFEAKSSEAISQAIKWALKNYESFFILGGGSNVLVSDSGFNGLVIKAANRDFKIMASDTHDKARVFAEAGAISSLLARKMAEAGLTGFEWAVSLPGTLGGAIRGNAGCFGGEIKDVLEEAVIFDPKRATSYKLPAVSCNFDYRDSVFKHKTLIVLYAILKLDKGDRQACLSKINNFLSQRKQGQPLSSSSAGCVFKNYKFQNASYKFPQGFLQAKSVPAGWLVEQAGLKGLKIGGAEISEKHGNFILNTGNAKARDVRELIVLIKQKVKEKFSLNLEEEIQYIGF